MMKTVKVARIANDVLLEEAGRSQRTAEDGTIVTFGRLKGTVALASTRIRVGDIITSFEVAPVSGKQYLAGRLSALLDEATITKCAEKAHQAVVTVNEWKTVSSEIFQH